ncbi:phosphate ABC transporter substrate-binding protein PstS [Bosea sp. TWI1241]|jgi:phosphate transport system substrate-binding protein|uniref:phosphate ABC transporter substrate-binding protein PstS n=1 Tax=Bosea sp. TWI1241 TaxID=3148904 RepID=UPI003208AC49
MRRLLIAAAAVIGLAGASQAADITGAGATFPFPIYAKWAEAYKKETNIGLNYQSIGSGGGIRQIRAKTVAFGATDAPLKGEDLEKGGFVQFPTVMGGVVPAVNIPGVAPGKLKLTGPILAEIYLGTIKKWNDPKIAKINEGLALPDANISPVYRSDGSGTTFVFTNYLSAVSEEFKGKLGNNTSVQWPVGIGGKGNEGVAASVKQVANSIGYVEYAYAKQNGLSHALIQNAEGNFPQPDEASFQAAAANADWKAAPGFGISLTNQKGAQAWPITAATFLLVYAKPDKPEETAAALKFVDWAFQNGDKMASELDYVALPANVKALVRDAWKGVTDKDGKPVL